MALDEHPDDDWRTKVERMQSFLFNSNKEEPTFEELEKKTLLEKAYDLLFGEKEEEFEFTGT